MRVAYRIAIAAGVFTVIVGVILVSLWRLGYFTKRSEPCLNPLFLETTSICVPSNQAYLIKSREQIIVFRRPLCRYYIIDPEHVGTDGKVTSMKHAKELTGEMMTIPERDTEIYLLVTE